MFNEKTIMTGSNVVMTWEVEEITQKGLQKRPGGIVLRMT